MNLKKMLLLKKKKKEKMKTKITITNSNISENVPNDIMENILSRLPDKSVSRFTNVSKAWNRLFNDPHFIKLQTNHSNRLIANNICYCKVVRFRSLDKPKEYGVCLELSKLSTYDEVVERVAGHLGVDEPSKIRLTVHNCYSQQPTPTPIVYRGMEHLSDMQKCDILYYEVLDIPLPELELLKILKIAYHHATKDEVAIHSIRLPKQSTVSDLIADLKTKVELSHPNAELRLLELFYHKIYKIFQTSEKIKHINDLYWTIRAEEIPEEEKNLGPNDRLIRVYHFTKDIFQNQMIRNFGEPFLFIIHEGETLAEVKGRIQKKLHVPDKEFSKWKFAFLSFGHPEYLLDSDIVSSRFQININVFGAWEQYLGLEHSDSTA